MQDCPAVFPDTGDEHGKETNPYSTPCGYPIADDGSAGGEYNAKIDINCEDARLIAAAPELLAVAKLALDIAKGNISGSEHGVIAQIKAAIAKAEGR